MTTDEPTMLVMEHLCSSLPNLTFIRGRPEYDPVVDTIELYHIGSSLRLGIDDIYFGFLKIRIYQTYMQPLQEIAETIDLVMDCALLRAYAFNKSGNLKFERAGTIKIGILTYEFKIEPSQLTIPINNKKL